MSITVKDKIECKLNIYHTSTNHCLIHYVIPWTFILLYLYTEHSSGYNSTSYTSMKLSFIIICALWTQNSESMLVAKSIICWTHYYCCYSCVELCPAWTLLHPNFCWKVTDSLKHLYCEKKPLSTEELVVLVLYFVLLWLLWRTESGYWVSVDPALWTLSNFDELWLVMFESLYLLRHLRWKLKHHH